MSHPAFYRAQLLRRVVSTGHCWRYQSTLKRYGRIRVNGRKMGAHRASWLAHHGAIPAGLLVLHKCDNPKCVNPDHLMLGTQVVNMEHRSARGRHWLQKHPERSSIHKWNAGHSKLTPADIPKIQAMRQRGEKQQAIADAFKVSRPLISLILSGKRR